MSGNAVLVTLAGIALVVALMMFKLNRAAARVARWETARRAFMTPEQRDQWNLEEWQDRQY